MALLEGRALDWALACFQRHAVDSFPFSVFQEELKRTFDHPLCEANAAKRLLNLKQGSQTVDKFVVKFRILAAETGWPDSVLQGVLIKALNEQMKDQLASREEPSSFEDLVTLVIRIDSRLAERQRERASCSQSPSTQRSAPYLLNLPPSRESSAPAGPPTADSVETMQVGRAMLPPEEHLRRLRANEYLYCSAKNHFISDCPIRPKDRAHQ